MPHFPKPFFKAKRGVWYVEINRKQHNLGPDKDEAFRRYHELMAAPEPARSVVASGELVLAVIDEAYPDLRVVSATDTILRWQHPQPLDRPRAEANSCRTLGR
jgi:integrase/recombinase XerD